MEFISLKPFAHSVKMKLFLLRCKHYHETKAKQ